MIRDTEFLLVRGEAMIDILQSAREVRERVGDEDVADLLGRAVEVLGLLVERLKAVEVVK